jgi:hypothetical protein
MTESSDEFGGIAIFQNPSTASYSEPFGCDDGRNMHLPLLYDDGAIASHHIAFARSFYPENKGKVTISPLFRRGTPLFCPWMDG